MKPKYSFEKSVGAVIFYGKGDIKKYLLLHYQSGHWDFPKGHAEEGENEADTLKREAKEETGIAELNIIPGFKKKIRYFYKAGKDEAERRKKEGLALNVVKNVIYYTAEAKTDAVKISFEHTGYEWLNYENALKKITYKNSKGVLKEANNFLTNNKQQQLLKV